MPTSSNQQEVTTMFQTLKSLPINLNLNLASSDQQLGVFKSRPAVAADIERTTNNFQRTTPRPAPPLRVTQVCFDHLRVLTLVPVLFVCNCQWLEFHRKTNDTFFAYYQGVTQEPRTPSPIRSRVISNSNDQVSPSSSHKLRNAIIPKSQQAIAHRGHSIYEEDHVCV